MIMRLLVKVILVVYLTVKDYCKASCRTVSLLLLSILSLAFMLAVSPVAQVKLCRNKIQGDRLSVNIRLLQ